MTVSNSETRSPIITQSLPFMASDDGPPVISESLDTTGTIRSSIGMLRDLEARIARIATRYDVKPFAQEDELSATE
ncbi:hypothetical protein CEP51_004978 [Fusarium floridanum]|uniref:Uncharacterized protein n=1 Tax=Fusarium floridanum TaxID=1325733 RepID=A0A428RZ69_9HYPO|nr:hypothetical protein CEP51_004978 [Fusarium floridanum]